MTLFSLFHWQVLRLGLQVSFAATDILLYNLNLSLLLFLSQTPGSHSNFLFA
jgi:hypothetical protein